MQQIKSDSKHEKYCNIRKHQLPTWTRQDITLLRSELLSNLFIVLLVFDYIGLNIELDIRTDEFESILFRADDRASTFLMNYLSQFFKLWTREN